MSIRGKVLIFIFSVLIVVGGVGLANSNFGFEGDLAEWGEYFPLQYQSFLKNGEMASTEFGGSEPVSKLDQAVYLKELYAGMPFSVEYKEDRGHVYAMDDVLDTARKKPAASCLSCKSSDIPQLVAAEGVDFYGKPFEAGVAQIENTIGCLNCHDSDTMELRIAQPMLIAALEKQGRVPEQLSNQELRTLVCAQCHVEYYFQADTKEPIYPWDKGLTVAAVEEYYDAIGFKDWTHPRSGTDLIKIQHPDYELFQSSVHAAAGVTCADCHMPVVSDGGVTYTSHWMTSPLKHLEASCTGCHQQDVDQLKERVLYTQRRTMELLERAGEANIAAIDAIEAASKKRRVNQKLLAEARALHRSAQVRFDWLAAENSAGFHNPQESLYLLGQSIDLAWQAVEKAQLAAK